MADSFTLVLHLLYYFNKYTAGGNRTKEIKKSTHKHVLRRQMTEIDNLTTWPSDDLDLREGHLPRAKDDA